MKRFHWALCIKKKKKISQHALLPSSAHIQVMHGKLRIPHGKKAKITSFTERWMNWIVYYFFLASRGVYNSETNIQQSKESQRNLNNAWSGHSAIGSPVGLIFCSPSKCNTVFVWFCEVCEGWQWGGTQRGSICLAPHWHSPGLGWWLGHDS